jgi:hypothetical protein
LQQSVCNFVERCNKLRLEIQEKSTVNEKLHSEVRNLRDIVNKLGNEAEVHNKKISDLRHNLKEATTDIDWFRKSTELKDNSVINPESVIFNTALQSYTSSPSRQQSYKKDSDLNNRRTSKSKSMSPQKSYLKKTVSTQNYGLGSQANEEDYLSNENALSYIKMNSVSNNKNSKNIDYNSNGNKNNNNTMSISTSANTSTTNFNKNKQLIGSPTILPISLTAPVSWLHIFRTDVQAAIDDGRCRDLTINECKEMIEKLYDSKSLANEKALKGVGNIPMETLEQHVFRSMEKNYGLRSIAVEHSGKLLKNVKKYSDDDCDVKIFKKIFNNEIEEGFLIIKNDLEKTIIDLTMIQIMNKNPVKDQNAIHKILENKIHSGFIYENDWNDIIFFLYNDVDAKALNLLLKKIASNKSIDDDSIDLEYPLGFYCVYLFIFIFYLYCIIVFIYYYYCYYYYYHIYYYYY